MKILSIHKFCILVGVLSLASCSQDDEIQNSSIRQGVEVTASIDNGSGDYKTRVEVGKGDGMDYWSFSRFSSSSFDARPYSYYKSNTPYTWEEAIGFYSNKGNLDEGTNGLFTNEKLVFAKEIGESNSSSFISTKMNIDLNALTSNGTIAYFPYTEDMEEKGLELRWVKNGENIERCIDGLIMRRINSGGGNSVSGLDFSFIHAFSEMIIVRGQGFEYPPEGQKAIRVVLDRGYSHAKITDYVSAPDDELRYQIYKVFNFVYQPDYEDVKSEEECRKWETWPGKYSITQSGSRPLVKDVQYALVPGGYGQGRPSVAYIEICDNNENWHKVTDFSLYENHSVGDKRLNWGERYLLEIKMDGLVPTVNPVVISPWGEDQKVDQSNASGIGSVSDFNDFVLAYNQYNNDRSGATSETIKTLSNYGDKTEDTNGNILSWRFYFIDNFEFTRDNPTIETLEENDIIDGYNSKLSNLTKPFIKNLKGSLIGLNFTVNMKSSGQDDNTNIFGAVATSITNGSVKGCSVSGTINYPKASVGMLAGEMNGGSVENCSFSGLIIGRESYNKIIGTSPTGSASIKSNNSTSGVLFSGETGEES